MTEREEKLLFADKLYLNKIAECYNVMAGYSRAYRDVCREMGCSDDEIKQKLEFLTSKAISCAQEITELIEQEGNNGKMGAEGGS